MSKLSFLEQLLDVSDIEWKPLGEIANITIGEFVHKDKQSPSAQYPVYNGGISNTGYYDKYNNTGDKIIVSARGANAGFVNRISKPYWAGNSCYSIGIENLQKFNWLYIFYFLKNSENKLIGEQQKGGIPAVSKKQMEALQIPIPYPNNPKKSLEIQSEIVRILEAFTELSTELSTELNLRKKQYNHYRDQLLNFKGGDVEWKALGELGEFIRGKRFTKADYVEQGINVIHYGEIYTRYGVFTQHSLSQVKADMAESLRYAEPGDVVITDVGETVEDVGKAVAWLGNEKVAIHDHCYAFRHSMNPKFVSYCLQTTSFIAEKAKYVARTKVNTLLINGFAKIAIPVPYPNDPEKSLAEQARIVAMLDKFDALTNSISEGLPCEITLRQKQYEYYRELLLSFPKRDTEVAA